MVELLSPIDYHKALTPEQLLDDGEIIVIVDDSPEIVIILEHYLNLQNFKIATANNASELNDIISSEKVGLVLLDIGLPDKSGKEILAELAPQHPDLGIIMVTGTTDIQTAIDCMRLGADDYLTKPVNLADFTHTVQQTLKKRRLAIDNRIFQRELKATNSRTHFLHQLNLKMNTVYLSTVELDAILHAVLVGITSAEGLKFNRAFLALFDQETKVLRGQLAIGPSSREDAGRLWQDIQNENLGLHNILKNIRKDSYDRDIEVNRIVQDLAIPASDEKHILIRATKERRSILVENGQADDFEVSPDLLQLLGEKEFTIIPLFSPSKSLGVLIADNFVTRKKIHYEEIHALEIFASQASLAIEHSHLYRDMTAKIEELELVTHELEKNKDMLVEAERYSTLGYISAQLVHAIRNPITSIGGTARLLAKRANDPKTLKFLNIMAKETTKIESTLEDLFSFVEDSPLKISKQSIHTLVRKSVMIFYGAMKNNGIEYDLNLAKTDPPLDIDPRKIRQVFLHLIRNAVEAMPSGGKLEVTTYDENDRFIITITDTGAGINELDLEQVKNPFFTTKTYGTGLGLTLVEQIIALHNATFSLQQRDSGGMIATIDFKKH
jgi:signal transduction histidine kinase